MPYGLEVYFYSCLGCEKKHKFYYPIEAIFEPRFNAILALFKQAKSIGFYPLHWQ